jgi:hypothetical protein
MTSRSASSPLCCSTASTAADLRIASGISLISPARRPLTLRARLKGAFSGWRSDVGATSQSKPRVKRRLHRARGSDPARAAS